MARESPTQTPPVIPIDLPFDPNQSYDPDRTSLYDESIPAPSPVEFSSPPVLGLSGEEPTDPRIDADRTIPDSDSVVPQLDRTELEPGATNPPTPQARALKAVSASAYTLSRQIGEGGVGEVWEAYQHALGRTIAVKRIRRDVFNERIGRKINPADLELSFRQEALTTGQLEHPNIVPIYDFASDEKGQPLLAMKRVKGIPWDTMIQNDFDALPVTEFLARHLPILIDVSNAVAYAHSRGIVHRDIKPSQVMVGEFGEVLLMDWGLSVSYDRSSTPVPDFLDRRDSGEYPLLVSPVIAPGLDTATNPCGTPSFMAPEQTSTNALRIGPWTDVYLLGGTLYKLLTGRPPHHAETATDAFQKAHLGYVEPPGKLGLDRDFPKPLVRLAMTALESDPARRISSAIEFRKALEDYITGADRRRESMALTREVAARARGIRGDYRQIAESINQLEQALLMNPENRHAHRLRAVMISRYARVAIANQDLVLARVQAERLPDGATRRELLEDVQVLEDNRFEASQRLVKAYGEVRKQRDRAEELLDFLLVELSDGLRRIGHLELLKLVAQRTSDFFESLSEEEVGDSTLLKRSLALVNIGDVIRDQGQLERAAQVFRDAQAMIQRLLERNPSEKEALRQLATCYTRLSDVYYEQRNLEGMRDVLQKALDIRETLARESPENLEWQNDYAWILGRIGVLEWRRMNLEKARRCQEESVQIRERIVWEDRAQLDWRDDLAWSYNSLGFVYKTLGLLEESSKCFVRGIEIRKVLVEIDASNTVFQRNLAWSLGSFGQVLSDLGEIDNALKHYSESLEILRSQVVLDPHNDALRRNVAWTLGSVGGVRRAHGHWDEAIAALTEAISIQQRLIDKEATFESLRHEQAWNIHQLGCVYHSIGNLPLALETLRRSLDLREERFKGDVTNQRCLNDICRSLIRIGAVLEDMCEDDEARVLWQQALDRITPAVTESGAPDFTESLAAALVLLGRGEEALPHIDGLLERKWKSDELKQFCERRGIHWPV